MSAPLRSLTSWLTPSKTSVRSSRQQRKRNIATTAGPTEAHPVTAAAIGEAIEEVLVVVATLVAVGLAVTAWVATHLKAIPVPARSQTG